MSNKFRFVQSSVNNDDLLKDLFYEVKKICYTNHTRCYQLKGFEKKYFPENLFQEERARVMDLRCRYYLAVPLYYFTSRQAPHSIKRFTAIKYSSFLRAWTIIGGTKKEDDVLYQFISGISSYNIQLYSQEEYEPIYQTLTLMRLEAKLTRTLDNGK